MSAAERRCQGAVTSPRGRLVCHKRLFLCAVYCCFQRSASLECRDLGCLDLDCFTGAGVTTGACCTLAHLECAETNQSNTITLLQRAGDDFDQSRNVAVSVCFGTACLVGQCINQFFSVHVFSFVVITANAAIHSLAPVGAV